MIHVEPLGLDKKTPCLRSYGRAEVDLQTSLETPHGRVRCLVLDLSLGGARVLADQPVELGEALWLMLRKAKVFGTVQWVQGNEIGVQFEEKLPKTLVLSLRGDSVDPQALEAVEAMLDAQDWVIGSPTARPKTLRLAEVLGARTENSAGSNRSGVASAPPSVSNLRNGAKAGAGIDRRALLLIFFAAVIGSLIGIASFLLQ
jgi:PilZ domain